MTKVERFKERGSVGCVKHGDHSDWYVSDKTIQCRPCKRQRDKLPENIKKQRAANRASYHKNSKVINEYRRERWNKHKLKLKLKRARIHSRKTGREFNVNYTYIENLLSEQQFQCYLTGLPIDTQSASIDRIDSSKGYIVGNIGLCVSDLNLMKLDLPLNQFVNYCKAVSIKWTQQN